MTLNLSTYFDEVKSLLDQGLSDRRIYSDPEIYRLEQQRIFARSWLIVAHESMIPNPGDFMESYMGEESVIVCRNRAGEVHVLLNNCRHRGNKVCRAESGNANSFMCPYHGWTFDSDGNFVSAPSVNAVYPDLNRADWGLLNARVGIYKGLIFANFDQHAVDLETYLGDFAWVLDMHLDRFPGGDEAAGGIMRWTINANWKFGAENAAGDMYHAATTHFSAMDSGHLNTGATRQQGGNRAQSGVFGPGFTMISPFGHGGNFSLRNPDAAGGYPTGGGRESLLRKWRRENLAASVEHVGSYRAESITRDNILIFPNAMFNLGSHDMHLFHPRGPNKTEVWLVAFVESAAPDEVKEEVRFDAGHHFGPAGLFEEDDGENFEQSTSGTMGVMAQTLPLNYQVGFGRETVLHEPGLPDRLDGLTTEYGQLSMLRRWVDLMAQR